MKRYILIAVGIAVAALCLEGCATVDTTERPAHVGRYYSVYDFGHFMTLYADETFLLHQGDGELRGEYHVEGEIIGLAVESAGMSLVGRIDGGEIVDNNDDRWVRAPRSFPHATIREESVGAMQARLPEGWLLRLWEGRYFICERPDGPAPPSLDASACVIVLRHGEPDTRANALNMIAETPEHTLHLSQFLSGELWPDATNDLLRIFIDDHAGR